MYTGKIVEEYGTACYGNERYRAYPSEWAAQSLKGEGRRYPILGRLAVLIFEHMYVVLPSGGNKPMTSQ